MKVVERDDVRWNELYGCALLWSDRSVEALCFKRSWEKHRRDLWSAPASSLFLSRRAFDECLIAAAGVRIACGQAVVEFALFDQDYLLADNDWQLYKQLLAEISRYAKSEEVAYIRLNLPVTEAYENLQRNLMLIAQSTKVTTDKEVDWLQLLCTVENVCAFAEQKTITG